MLLLATARPDLLDPQPEWPHPSLEPLNRHDAETLMRWVPRVEPPASWSLAQAGTRCLSTSRLNCFGEKGDIAGLPSMESRALS